VAGVIQGGEKKERSTQEKVPVLAKKGKEKREGKVARKRKKGRRCLTRREKKKKKEKKRETWGSYVKAKR